MFNVSKSPNVSAQPSTFIRAKVKNIICKNHIRPSGICYPKQKIQYRKIRIVAPFTQSHAKIVIRVISQRFGSTFNLHQGKVKNIICKKHVSYSMQILSSVPQG